MSDLIVESPHTRKNIAYTLVCSLVLTFLSLMVLPVAYAEDISSCGYLNKAGTTYVLQNDVTANGTCFFVTAENITLDLNNHTVTYDDASPVSAFNGDFEMDGGWDTSSAPNAAIVTGSYVKPVTLYSGSKSLKFALSGPDQSVSSTSSINLEPKTTYTLSAMVYNQVSDTATVYVELSGTETRAGRTGKTWRGFQYVTISFTTGNSAESVSINAGISGAGASEAGYVFIDDIRIQRTRFAGVAVGPASWQGTSVIADVTQFGNANYATIKNGTIQQGKGEADFSNCITVMENSGIGWKLSGLTLRASGANCKAINSKNARDASITNNHIYNHQRAITSRDAFDGAAVKVEYPGYGNLISGNYIHQGVQTAFYISQKAGELINEIFNNTIELQSRHTNDFAIVAGGAKIHNNNINCGTDDNSCRGIAVAGTNTLVYDNTVNVQELPRNQEYNGCSLGGAYGMQMEANTTGLQVYGNTVNAIAGECEAHAFRANPYAEGGTGSSNNIVRDNTFNAIANGSGRASTLKFSKMTMTDVTFTGNIFKTNHRWIYVDGGGSVTNPSFNKNRWETAGTLPISFYPFEVFTWADSHFNGSFVDNLYGEGDKARFENEFIRVQGDMSSDPLSSYELSWTLDINSTNQLSQPASNVPIIIKDVNELVVYSGNTDSQGKSSIPLSEFKKIGEDKTYFTPYTVTATRLNQSFTDSITLDSPKSFNFTFDTTPPVTTISLDGNNFPYMVTLTPNEFSTVYYTLDGALPTTASAVFETSFTLNGNNTLKYFAVDTAGNSELVKTVFDTTPPKSAASPVGDSFLKKTLNVTLMADEPSNIYYTLDGSTPNTSSSVYLSPIILTSSTQIKFFAVDTSGNVGAINTENYTLDNTSPVTSATPAGGINIYQTMSISLSSNEEGVTYYTTDNSDPTSSSTICSTPISINGNTTLKYFTVDVAGNSEIVKTENYSFNHDGRFDKSGATPSVSDALRALLIATGIQPANSDDRLYGDVSPIVSGVPQPDGVIDASDAMCIMRRAVGLGW